jgi:hypothetical protein
VSGATSRPLINLLIWGAIVAELIVLVGHPLFGWGPQPKSYLTTPQPVTGTPSGGQVLLALSRAAAGRPAPQVQRYAYVERQQWRLPTAGERAPKGAAQPTVIRSWLAADGSGRVITATARANGNYVDATTTTLSGPSLPALSSLQSSPSALARLIGVGSHPGSGDAPAWELNGFARLAEQQPIPPGDEAVLLRLLARIPGLVNRGTVLDRDGRVGLAVSLDSSFIGETVRYTLVLDPSTGALEEEDQALVGEAGPLDVRDSSVLAYTTFVDGGYVSSPNAQP